MKPRHHTDTTYERLSSYNGDRQVITVLRLGTAWAYCVIETIPRDGRNVADALGNVPRKLPERWQFL